MGFLHRLTAYSVLWAVIMAMALAGAELVLRTSGRVPTASVHAVSEEDYARIPGMLEPGQDLTERPHPHLAYHVRINSLGYRGPEIERLKPRGTVRILCLGDSGTFGQFVQDDETVTAYLEQFLLQEHLPVQVINNGVPGTTLVDQMAFLRRSMELQPDIVILTFSENDITDLFAEIPQHAALERNRVLKSKPGFRQFYSLVRDTALFNYALTVRAAWAARIASPPSPAILTSDGNHGTGPYEAAWEQYSTQLDVLAKYLANRDISLLFNAFPTHHRIGTVTMTDQTMLSQLPRIEALARTKGIRTIEVLPRFLQSGLDKEDLYLLPYDGHANKNGYRLQAMALLPAVRETVVKILQSKTDLPPFQRQSTEEHPLHRSAPRDPAV